MAHKNWDFSHDPHERPLGCNGKYGTSGIVAHSRKGEPTCEACRASRNHYMRELRRNNPSPRKLHPCGTPAAYHRHERKRERKDFACRLAHSKYRQKLAQEKS